MAACVTPLRVAKAKLGYDPFAGNTNHTEERWTPNSTAANATSYNFSVTAPDSNTNGAFLTGDGNIYNPTSVLILMSTSAFAVPVGAFQTVIFSIKTLSNPLNTAGVTLRRQRRVRGPIGQPWRWRCVAKSGTVQFVVA